MNLYGAYHTTDIELFLHYAFPPHWEGVAARILETGAEFTFDPVRWAPLWSGIPVTMRKEDEGPVSVAHKLASVLYRSHDCLHQLWGLPFPTDRHLYMRAQMCGEVAVLAITEFALASEWAALDPEYAKAIARRNALPLLQGPLQGLSLIEIAGRLNDILHLRTGDPPAWVRENPTALAFFLDYDAMLSKDREMINACLDAWEVHGPPPLDVPTFHPDPRMTGTELTRWMIESFLQTTRTRGPYDRALRRFNQERRKAIKLPEGWAS